MNLANYKNIYFLGIKGAGLTGLAQVLKKMGHKVWGSDVAEVFFTDQVLKRSRIKVLSGFKSKQITDDIDLVIYSTAYDKKNVELKTAVKKKIPILSYPQAIGSLFAGRYGIAVCGTHGKTTTTAMLGYVLQELGQDPLVIVGSAVKQFGGNARYGRGDYLVVEADEYQNKLRYYRPRAIILTSADFDHPDYFKNQKAYNKVFKHFIKSLPGNGLVIAFTDDKNVREIIKSATCRVVAYGRQDVYNFKLAIPGEYNRWNALAVLTLIKELGLDVSKARKIIENFKGVKRRFELLGKKNKILVYDDYAHHPTEVKQLLKMARAEFPDRKIWAVFQSHTYTRTKALLPQFAKAFKPADQVIVLDIFGSAREKHGGVTPQDLVTAINKYSKNASYRGNMNMVVNYLAGEVKSGDVVLTIGAGENWKVGVDLLEKLGKERK